MFLLQLVDGWDRYFEQLSDLIYLAPKFSMLGASSMYDVRVRLF